MIIFLSIVVVKTVEVNSINKKKFFFQTSKDEFDESDEIDENSNFRKY